MVLQRRTKGPQRAEWRIVAGVEVREMAIILEMKFQTHDLINEIEIFLPPENIGHDVISLQVKGWWVIRS